MNLNVDEWKEFYLGRLFDIRKGKRLTSADQEEGDNNYIGAIDSNNGVANHIGQPPIHEGNTISLSYNGSVGEAFYQCEPYWATDDVNALYCNYEGFNQYIGLFIATVIRNEKYKFSYGRKWTLENMNASIIRLPIQHNPDGTPYIDPDCTYSEEGYVPDWQFMEDYIKSLNHKPLTTQNTDNKVPKLNTQEWEEFKIGNLFDIHPTKTIPNVTASDCLGYGCPLVVNSAENNGIAGMCDLQPTEKGGIITFSDTTDGNTFFYQNDDFIGFSHVQGMYHLSDKWNKYSLLFFATIIMYDCNGKFNYGRKMRRDIILDTYVKLPVQHNSDGTPYIDPDCTYSKEGYVPDWQFMEDYIRLLPYGDRL